MTTPMAEVRFYHLTDFPLERALPTMLERALSRGQRAVIRGGHGERLRYLDAQLWTADAASFLPHGIDGDPEPARHPIWLTETTALPNAPDVLFLIDGSDAGEEEFRSMTVTAILFDGHDPAAVAAARTQWRRVAGAGVAAVYWAQEGGRWVKKQETRPEEG